MAAALHHLPRNRAMRGGRALILVAEPVDASVLRLLCHYCAPPPCEIRRVVHLDAVEATLAEIADGGCSGRLVVNLDFSQGMARARRKHAPSRTDRDSWGQWRSRRSARWSAPWR